MMLTSACSARREALKTPDPVQKAITDQKSPANAVPAPPAPQQLAENEKKLDGTLIEIARANRSGGQASAVKQLTASGADQKNRKISVEIIAANKEAVPELKKRLKDSGAEIVSDLENHVWVYLPLSAIDQFSGMSSVWSMAVARATTTAK